MNRSIYIIVTFLFITLNTQADTNKVDWTEEQMKIIDLNHWVPLAPKEAGFKAYADLFHPEYTNWFMAGDTETLRTREQFLGAVKKWVEAGNHAIFSKVVPISVEIFGDYAYIRHLQEEHFYHPDSKPTMFVGHFASLMKRHKGQWKFYRTSFQSRYRGPIEGSTINLDKYQAVHSDMK